jgi:SAM-dependent methyltransferase
LNHGVDAEAWDARYRDSELVWSRGPNQFVEAELAGTPPGRALDLAAGEGRNAIWLAERGWQVTAVDFSQAGLDKGRTLAGDLHVEWVCADATTWTGDGSYDVCVVAYLQLAGDERRAAVRGAFGSLRVGGTLLLVAHDSTNLTEGVGGPQDPDVLMTAEEHGDHGETHQRVPGVDVASVLGAHAAQPRRDGAQRTVGDDGEQQHRQDEGHQRSIRRGARGVNRGVRGCLGQESALVWVGGSWVSLSTGCSS